MVLIRAASLTGLSLELQRANTCASVALTFISAEPIGCNDEIAVTFTVPCVDTGIWSLRVTAPNYAAFLPVNIIT